MKSKPKYKIFIDDTGSKTYHSPYNPLWQDNLGSWNKYRAYAEQNFFVLTAVVVDIAKLHEINNAVNNLKDEYFQTHEVEIKSVNLRNLQKQKKFYLDKYKLSLDQLHEFVLKLYDTILNYKQSVSLISIVFNKMAYSERKRLLPDGNPFLKTTHVLFDRIAYLNKPSELIIDQMESALKATKGKNGEIYRIYTKQQNFEIDFKVDYTRISKVIFKKSSSDNFLQIADLFGYNVFRQFVDFGFDSANKYNFYEKITTLFKNENGEILGKGLIVLGNTKDGYKNKKSRVKQDFLKSVS